MNKLLVKLTEKQFDGVTTELREDILKSYARMKTPDLHGIKPHLTALKLSAKGNCPAGVGISSE